MIGFAIGLLFGAAAVLGAARILGRGHRLVAVVLGPEPSPNVELIECPDVPLGDAAVDPADLPEVITADEARSAPALVRKVKHPEARALIQAIAHWNPKRHRSERKFQESFRDFLKDSGAAYSAEFDVTRFQRHPTLRFARNKIARPDFTYGTVLIELKRGLTASGETDRALGQLLRYLWLWRSKGPAVLVICGAYDKHLQALAQNYVRGWRAQGIPIMALFVRDSGQEAFDEVPEVEAPEPNDEPEPVTDVASTGS